MSGTKRNADSNGCNGTEKDAPPPTKKMSDGGNATTSDDAATNEQSSKKNDSLTSKDYYFDSYSHHGIHEEMLKDQVRTRTYQLAILNNKHLFEGKIILDVGCGTGILSMFAVQAGAAHVYGVDCSGIIESAKRIVKDNGMEDKITLIKGKIEEIDLPVKEVDIIVSEWMGYFLLYESMLNTVLHARDKWLKPGGVIFPDKAVMYISALEDEQMKFERIDFWENVYGFNMSVLKEAALKEPVVDIVDPKHIVTSADHILNIDLNTCTEKDLSFSSQFRIQAERSDYVHAFVAYFECAFTNIHKPLGFSTSPQSKYTHWKQTIFYLSEPMTVCEGEEITGTITCKPNVGNVRDLDIELDVKFDGSRSKVDTHIEYRLR